MCPSCFDMCVFVVLACCWCFINTMALPVTPSQSFVLKDAKKDGIAKADASLLLQPAELLSNDEDTWPSVDFLEYLRDMMAMFCPTKDVNRTTCKDNYPTIDTTESIRYMNIWEHWRRRTSTKVEDTEVRCGQLVDLTTGKNVACVLYVYDSKAILANPKLPSNRVY